MALKVVATLGSSAPVRCRSECELVALAQAGDASAFKELVVQQQRLVRAYVYSLTGKLETSEEIAQEVFITAWQRLSHLRNPAAFRSWLVGIARTLIRRFRSDEHNRPRTSSLDGGWRADLPSTEPSPLESAISREEEALVWRAIARIPEAYRLPLVLFYRSEQSVDDVARALDLSPVNVKVRLLRARRM